MLHPKPDEHVNPSVELHDLIGKLSTVRTLLTEMQRKVATRPGKHLFVIRERLYAHPVDLKFNEISLSFFLLVVVRASFKTVKSQTV